MPGGDGRLCGASVLLAFPILVIEVSRWIVNFTFHSLGQSFPTRNNGENPLRLSQERYESILDVLVDEDDVIITFDDGTSSQVEIGLPALLDRRLRAYFFVPAGRFGQPGSLSPSDLRMLRDRGMTIGSHGMHHRSWRGLSDRGLHEELVSAKEMLEQILGEAVCFAACPLGAYDRRVLAALRQVGYTRVYTSDRGPASASAWLQARYTLHFGDDADTVTRILGTARRRWRRVLHHIRQVAKSWR